MTDATPAQPATDLLEDLRALSARMRPGERGLGAVERAAAISGCRGEFVPVWAYGSVSAATARVMLWYAVEMLAGVPDVEARLIAAMAEHRQRFAVRAAAARQAVGVLGPAVLGRMHDHTERLVVEELADEDAAVRLLRVVREVAGMSPAARLERQQLEGAAAADGSEVARLAAVREVADWLGALRGRGDDGKVYADVAELKLRTALGEHSPDGPCGCPGCLSVTKSGSGAIQEA